MCEWAELGKRVQSVANSERETADGREDRVGKTVEKRGQRWDRMHLERGQSRENC
jgi:hypothetical protein